jgi:hypothetical protein
MAAEAAREVTAFAQSAQGQEMQRIAVEAAQWANALVQSPGMQATARMAAEATRGVTAFAQSAQGQEMQRIAVEAAQWANSPYVKEAMQATATHLAYCRSTMKISGLPPEVFRILGDKL